MPFLAILTFRYEFGKIANSSKCGYGVFPIPVRICVAAIGVCDFRCADSGLRTFYLEELKMKKFGLKILSLLLITVLLTSLLISCGSKVKPVNCAHVWVDGNCTTPKACTLCNATEGEPLGHLWMDATCTSQKTCTRCNTTEGDALGHSWLDASESEPKKCSVCGITEGDALLGDNTPCTHEASTERTIDLTSYNLCIKELLVLSCKCGQSLSFPDIVDQVCLDGIEELNTTCCWLRMEYDEERDDDGNILNSCSKYVCWDCELELERYVTPIDDNVQCTTAFEQKLTVSVNGTSIVNDISVRAISTAHEYDDFERIDLSQYCGGTYYTSECTVCNEKFNAGLHGFEGYDGVLESPFECSISHSDIAERTETDENGIEHTVKTVTCPDCGLRFVGDTYPRRQEGCETYGTRGVSVYNSSNDVIFDAEWSLLLSGKHDYDIERKSLGNGIGCSVEYAERNICKECGHTDYAYIDSGHSYVAAEIDLSEYSSCGGSFTYGICKFCNQTSSDRSDFYSVGCEDIEGDMYAYGPDEEVDDNGITHDVYSATCSDCGLYFEKDLWVEMQSSCEGTHFTKIRIVNDGREIISILNNYNTDFHIWEITNFELSGSTCDDGVNVTYTCSTCGNVEQYTESYCNYQYVTLELGDEYHDIEVFKCIYCGTVEECEARSCMFSQTGTDSEGYPIYSCNYCDLTITDKTETGQKDENCEYYVTGIKIYYADGEEVARENVSYYSYDHDYEEVDRVMNGTTCEDGITITYRCNDCSDTIIDYVDYHIMSYYDMSSEVYGFCPYHYFTAGVCPCNWNNVVNYDGTCENNEYACGKCNYRIVDEVNGSQRTVTLYNDAEVIYTYTEPYTGN